MAVSAVTGGSGVQVDNTDPTAPIVRSDELFAAQRAMPFVRKRAAELPLSGMKMWLDTDRQYRIDQANGVAFPLGLLEDLSGDLPSDAPNEFFEWEMVIVDGPYMPPSLSANGRYVLAFDAGTATRYMFNSPPKPLDFVHSNNCTMYLVFSRPDDVNFTTIFGTVHFGSGGYRIAAIDDDTCNWLVTGAAGAVVCDSNFPLPGNNLLHVVSIISQPQHADPAQRATIYVNGDGPTNNNEATDDVDPGTSFTVSTLGGQSDTAESGLWTGLFGELLIFDRVHDGAQRAAVEAYLTAKWGELMP